MSNNTRKRYNEEFKVEAVKLVTERAYSLTQAAKSLGVSVDSISKWKKRLEETLLSMLRPSMLSKLIPPAVTNSSLKVVFPETL